MISWLDRRALLLSFSAGAEMSCLSESVFESISDGCGTPLPKGEAFPKRPKGMSLAGIAGWDPGSSHDLCR